MSSLPASTEKSSGRNRKGRRARRIRAARLARYKRRKARRKYRRAKRSYRRAARSRVPRRACLRWGGNGRCLKLKRWYLRKLKRSGRTTALLTR